MTELMKKYTENRKTVEAELKTMSNSRLLAELDDTLQFDILKMDTSEYTMLPRSQMGVYRAILKEISSRLTEEAEIKARAGQTWSDDNGYAGHYDDEGNAIVDFEPGTDADFDRYAVDVQNGDGYYDADGEFHYYSLD